MTSGRGPELGRPYADLSSEAARTRERMDAARSSGARELSRRSRLATGLIIALLLLALVVVALAGWVDLVPET